MSKNNSCFGCTHCKLDKSKTRNYCEREWMRFPYCYASERDCCPDYEPKKHVITRNTHPQPRQAMREESSMERIVHELDGKVCVHWQHPLVADYSLCGTDIGGDEQCGTTTGIFTTADVTCSMCLEMVAAMRVISDSPE